MSVLSDFRKKHNIGCTAMERLVRVGAGTIKLLEAGEREPRHSTRLKLADTMGVPLYSLYEQGALSAKSGRYTYTRQDCGHDSPCWIWNGARGGGSGEEYGRIFLTGSKKAYAHRFFYEEVFGPIANGCELHHLCQVKLCCNPWHLETVTRSRHLEITGQGAKLSPWQVREVRRAHEEAELTAEQLGKAFGVHKRTIYALLAGRYYSHVA